MKPSKIFEVYEDRSKIYTKNLTPGKTFFKERTNDDYREFDPRHSKLAAAIMRGCSNVFIRKGNTVLYLGASHGYTTSFVSDMVGNDGFIFALDSAPRVVRDLVFLAQERKNIAPMLADANHPEEYLDKVTQVDILYQDIAQRNQVEILLKNAKLFLKPGGYALIAIKSRSIDITRKPSQLFNEARAQLDKVMPVVDFRRLEPFEEDHCFMVCKKR
jgi:fibrillarin-like pre-rRNA processing protein